MHCSGSVVFTPAIRYLLLWILLGVFSTLGGCIERKDRLKLLQEIETAEMRLTPTYTGAPDLMLTVPAAFRAEWEQKATHDNFYVYDPGDSGDVQNGMIVLNVTYKPIQYLPDSLDVDEFAGEIEGREVVWRESTLEEGGDPVYRRETVLSNAFSEYFSQQGNELFLHAFVVGKDLRLVETLVGSVESIRIAPRSEL